jgi:hypothetical protein
LMTEQVHHPIFARLYERIASTADRRRADEHSRTLLDGLVDRIIEVGAGNGTNFPYYPASVEQAGLALFQQITGVTAVIYYAPRSSRSSASRSGAPSSSPPLEWCDKRRIHDSRRQDIRQGGLETAAPHRAYRHDHQSGSPWRGLLAGVDLGRSWPEVDRLPGVVHSLLRDKPWAGSLANDLRFTRSTFAAPP